MQPQPARIPMADHWRARMQGQKPAFYWAIAGLIGAASIRLADAQSPERLFIPTFTLIAYAWLAYHHVNQAAEPALRATRLAQLADSLYFLGFLWTLWALIDSFVFRRMSNAEGIFTVFGYALVTTAMGMFLRLLLLQFRYGVEEQSGEAQIKVEEQLHAFTLAISESMGTLQHFRTGVERSTEALTGIASLLQARAARVESRVAELEGIGEQIQQANAEQIKATVEHLMTQFVATVAPPFQALAQQALSFNEAVKQSTMQLDAQRRDLCSTITRHTDEIGAGLTCTSEEVQKGATAIGARLDELARHIGRIRIPADIVASTDSLARKVSDLETALESITRNVRTGGVAVQLELTELAGRIRPLRLPEDLVERVQSLNTALQQLGRAISEFEHTVAGSSKSLNDTAVKLQSIRVPATVEIDLSGVTNQVEDLASALHELQRSLGKRAHELNYDTIRVLRTND